MTKLIDIVRDVAYPVTNSTVLAAFVMFYLLLELITNLLSGGPQFLIAALIFGAFAVPAQFLYLMDLLEARAKGADPTPPSVEHLQWFGNLWSLMQLLYIGALIYAAYILGSLFGAAVLLIVLLVFAAILPASLAILALTHSAAESLNPRAIVRLIKRCGAGYWTAPTFFLVALFCSGWLSTIGAPDWLTELASLYFLFVFYTLIGGTVRPHDLHREVDIHEPVEPDAAVVDAALARRRTIVLNHAYGFVSRDNRAGGLQHVTDWIDRDPEPDSAWAWFFEQMLRWEIKDPALLFGQQYLGRLLDDGDDIAAVKLMLRCRLENEAFRPLAEDRERALEAAERCQHVELASLLR